MTQFLSFKKLLKIEIVSLLLVMNKLLNPYIKVLLIDGFDIKHLLLNDISENADIKIGDSIITGGMSLIFPEGINIGVVSKIIKPEKFNDTILNFNIDNQVKIANIKFRENYLNIEVKLHTDMNNLNNIYVLESLNIEEFKNINK